MFCLYPVLRLSPGLNVLLLKLKHLFNLTHIYCYISHIFAFQVVFKAKIVRIGNVNGIAPEKDNSVSRCMLNLSKKRCIWGHMYKSVLTIRR